MSCTLLRHWHMWTSPGALCPQEGARPGKTHPHFLDAEFFRRSTLHVPKSPNGELLSLIVCLFVGPRACTVPQACSKLNMLGTRAILSVFCAQFVCVCVWCPAPVCKPACQPANMPACKPDCQDRPQLPLANEARKDLTNLHTR